MIQNVCLLSNECLFFKCKKNLHSAFNELIDLEFLFLSNEIVPIISDKVWTTNWFYSCKKKIKIKSI